MEMVQIAALSLIAVFVAVELKAYKTIYGLLVATGVMLLILCLFAQKIQIVIEQINSLAEKTNASGQFSILIKALGVSYLSEVSSGICQDAGFSSIASQIKIFAKIYIVILGVPVLLAFVEMLECFAG